MLLETMAEGAVLVDNNGKIRVWNKAMTEIAGYNSQEVLGKTTAWLRAPECIGSEQINSLLTSGENSPMCITRCECRIISKSGEHIPIMVNARVLNDKHGNALGILQTVTDIRPLISLKKEIEAMASKISSESNFHGIAGRSPQMQRVFRLISLAAESEASVMILGESGTGKELVAEAIHKLSQRKNKSFVKVNCGAIPETLLESELFGHEKGAFTGANARKLGRFELADGGTVFLDEVGEMSPAMQVKLLRFLQERNFERVGGTHLIQVDVRVIAATNRDLGRAVKEGCFREDLYYRLNVVPIKLPPLRERKEDIALLCDFLIKKHTERLHKKIKGISPQALRALKRYPWPGNIRELDNVIERAIILTQNEIIQPQDLRIVEPPIGNRWRPLKEVEREYVDQVLEYTRGDQEKALRILGISPEELTKIKGE